MAVLIELPSLRDERGMLTVIEQELPFEVKRVYYIHDVNALPRGGHRHLTTRQALICLQGSCAIQVRRGTQQQEFILRSPSSCLLLEPEDWHQMWFSPPAILLVLASTHYSPEDYVYDIV